MIPTAPGCAGGGDWYDDGGRGCAFTDGTTASIAAGGTARGWACIAATSINDIRRAFFQRLNSNTGRGGSSSAWPSSGGVARPDGRPTTAEDGVDAAAAPLSRWPTVAALPVAPPLPLMFNVVLEGVDSAVVAALLAVGAVGGGNRRAG